MKDTDSRHETAFALPHRYPEDSVLQIDAQETAAAQAKPRQCKTVYKAAALSFFTALSDESSA
jgi:hypothetical protein